MDERFYKISIMDGIEIPFQGIYVTLPPEPMLRRYKTVASTFK